MLLEVLESVTYLETFSFVKWHHIELANVDSHTTLQTGRIILFFSLLNVADRSHNIMLFPFKRGGPVA
jgi:hypothetical protein